MIGGGVDSLQAHLAAHYRGPPLRDALRLGRDAARARRTASPTSPRRSSRWRSSIARAAGVASGASAPTRSESI